MKASKLLLRLIIVSLPVLCVMAAINYVVDPALVIREGNYEEQIAQGILDGKNAAINTNYNERKLQRILVSNLEKPYSGIIVGSSRIMYMSCDAFGPQNWFCNGVSGATIEDIISIIGMYDQRDMLPSTIVIGIDPWLFNKNHGDTRYMELIPEYNYFADKIGVEAISANTPNSSNQFQKFVQLLSPTYFQASLIEIRLSPVNFLSKIEEIRTTPASSILSYSISADYTTKLSDGSVVMAENNRLKDEEAINQSVISRIGSGQLYHSENYDELSPYIINQLTCLVDYLESNDVVVIFVMPPLHPIIYDYISETRKYRMLIEIESYVLDYANKRGITVIGSVNPDEIGAENTDFYDFIHPTREFMTSLCNG